MRDSVARGGNDEHDSFLVYGSVLITRVLQGCLGSLLSAWEKSEIILVKRNVTSKCHDQRLNSRAIRTVSKVTHCAFVLLCFQGFRVDRDLLPVQGLGLPVSAAGLGKRASGPSWLHAGTCPGSVGSAQTGRLSEQGAESSLRSLDVRF